MAAALLPDQLWDLVEPLLPIPRRRPQGGRPRVSDRACLTGIVFVLRSGIPWQMLPQELGCGTRIVFSSNRTSINDLYQKLTSGAGVEERLVASDQLKAPTSWSADGRFLLYRAVDPQTNIDLWVVPMVGTRTPSVFVKTPFGETQAAFSPDSRWVAYQLNESGRDEIYVRPFVPPGAAGTAAGAPAGQWQV